MKITPPPSHQLQRPNQGIVLDPGLFLVVAFIFLVAGFQIAVNYKDALNKQNHTPVSYMQKQIYLAYIRDQLDSVPYPPNRFNELVEEGVRKLERGEIPSFEEISALKLAAARGQYIKKLLERLIEFLQGRSNTISVEKNLIIPKGSPVKILRIAKGWTLAELASRAGMAISTVSVIETGKLTRVKDSTWESIGKALAVDPEWLKEQNQNYLDSF